VTGRVGVDKTGAPCRLAWRRWLLFAACVMCLAPTPGDIGSCGQPAELLGARQFFQKKRELDCRACTECELRSRQCTRACSTEAGSQDEFDVACFALVHDGEVCLRALQYSSCDDYQTYVRDEQAETPTECNFCPPRNEQTDSESDDPKVEPETGGDAGR
jgi:hypothetical protein